MVKDYKKKVLKFEDGGYVGDEERKKELLARLAKKYPDEYGALPVTVKDRKTGKIDVDQSVRLRARNESEGFKQKLDRKYPNAAPTSALYKTKRKTGG